MSLAIGDKTSIDTLLNGDFMALGDPALPWQAWMGA